MKRLPKLSHWGPFGLELVAYAGLVFVYFILVLHFLGNWLKQIFDHNRIFYAILAWGLIVVQGVALEMLTRFLLKLMQRRSD